MQHSVKIADRNWCHILYIHVQVLQSDILFHFTDTAIVCLHVFETEYLNEVLMVCGERNDHEIIGR